jgi:large subunit ribosomal protein L29
MKSKEIKAMSLGEMKAKQDELVKELFNLRIQNAGVQLENPMRIRYVRKDIARVKTIIAEKEKEA